MFLKGAGARKNRQGHGICYRQPTKSQQIHKQLIFHLRLLQRCFTHVDLGWWSPRLEKNKATKITETMPIATGNLAMWKVQLASCNVQWANRNYGCLLFVDFHRDPQLPKPHVEHAAVVYVGWHCVQARNLPRGFPLPNLACTTPFPNQRKYCLSMVVGWVCTNRYRSCRGCASYLQFSKNNKIHFRRKKKKTHIMEGPILIFHFLYEGGPYWHSKHALKRKCFSPKAIC